MGGVRGGGAGRPPPHLSLLPAPWARQAPDRVGSAFASADLSLTLTRVTAGLLGSRGRGLGDGAPGQGRGREPSTSLAPRKHRPAAGAVSRSRRRAAGVARPPTNVVRRTSRPADSQAQAGEPPGALLRLGAGRPGGSGRWPQAGGRRWAPQTRAGRRAAGSRACVLAPAPRADTHRAWHPVGG